MPNIIINNYCNQKCEYCFAEANMSNPLLKRQMSVSLYIIILKFLKINKEEVRILWGEPLLHPDIHLFLQLAMKGEFPTIIFSNINIESKKLHEIFDNITELKNLRINCNINNSDFYSEREWDGIKNNIIYLREKGIKIILGYNVYTLEKSMDFIFQLALENGIEAINLKVTNSSIGESLIIDTQDRRLGDYIFRVLKLYGKKFFIEISCGLDASIFTESEKNFIENEISTPLRFGCGGNMGRFDINTNGNIFKCFPLESIYQKKSLSIRECLIKKMSTEEVISYLYTRFNIRPSTGECIANSIIKTQGN